MLLEISCSFPHIRKKPVENILMRSRFWKKETQMYSHEMLTNKSTSLKMTLNSILTSLTINYLIQIHIEIHVLMIILILEKLK